MPCWTQDLALLIFAQQNSAGTSEIRELKSNLIHRTSINNYQVIALFLRCLL